MDATEKELREERDGVKELLDSQLARKSSRGARLR